MPSYMVDKQPLLSLKPPPTGKIGDEGPSGGSKPFGSVPATSTSPNQVQISSSSGMDLPSIVIVLDIIVTLVSKRFLLWIVIYTAL